MKYKQYVRTPDITIVPGFKVTKKTKLRNESKNGWETIENLVFTKYEKIETEQYTTETKTVVPLKEGQVILVNGEQGFVVPLEGFKTLDEAIEDYKAMKED